MSVMRMFTDKKSISNIFTGRKRVSAIHEKYTNMNRAQVSMNHIRSNKGRFYNIIASVALVHNLIKSN